MGEAQRSRTRKVAIGCALAALVAWGAGAQRRPDVGGPTIAAVAASSIEAPRPSGAEVQQGRDVEALRSAGGGADVGQGGEAGRAVDVGALRSFEGEADRVGDVDMPRLAGGEKGAPSGAGGPSASASVVREKAEVPPSAPAAASSQAVAPSQADAPREGPRKGAGRKRPSEADALMALCKDAGDSECARWVARKRRPQTSPRLRGRRGLRSRVR